MTVDNYKSLIILKFVQSFIGMARKVCVRSIDAHCIYTLTQMPVCVVIKALKLEGTVEEQARIRSRPIMFTTHTHNMTLRNDQPLQAQHK